MNNLKAINGCVLIELAERYEFAATLDKQHDTKTSGIVRSMSAELDQSLLGSKVWFPSYQDDIKVDIDGKEYTFIKYEDIRGFLE